MPRRLLRTEDRTENRLESINGNSILFGTNFQGEKLVLATENSLGAMIELREREAVWRRSLKQTRTQWSLKLQEHQLKGDQRDEEEAELNPKGKIEFCPETLWEVDRQSQETVQEEPLTQPRRLRTQSCHKE